MPESNSPETRVDPAALPPETWIAYADFAHLMPGTNRRMVEDNAKAGRWIAGYRATPRKPMFWRAGDVAQALAQAVEGAGQ